MSTPPVEENRNIEQDVQAQILRIINEINNGFNRVMFMYTIAFYSGIAVIFISITASLFYKDNIFVYFFGGAGVTEIIAFFVFKPAEDLQKSRAALAQLISAFLTWFSDAHNWNSAYQKELDNNNNFENLENISTRSIVNTFAVIMTIQTFIQGKQSASLKNLQDLTKTLQEKIQNLRPTG